MKERNSRIKKLETIRKLGLHPYPSSVDRTHTCNECLLNFDGLFENKQTVCVAGRIRMIRKHGGSIFLTIEDATARLQIYVKRDSVPQNDFMLTDDLVDIGDFIQVKGALFRTRLGEKTVHVEGITMLAKSLLPLPEKWHGLSDVETRYRKRYLDLIANPSVREIFKKRSAIIRELRNFFTEKEFLEVETPILQQIPGGANARPFATHHNSLNQNMYLRIAPELFLKRLIVGGYERVFEIGRAFRNEGIDNSHNPEFTIAEAYMAYTDYKQLMDLVEELFMRIVRTLKPDTPSAHKPFTRITYLDALHTHTGIAMDILRNEHELRPACIERNIDKDKLVSHGAMLDELTKNYVLGNFIEPTFLIDHPAALSPLAKRKKSDSSLVERFQLIAQGKEIVNAFSELNDPIDQMNRFIEQEKNRKKGDQEAHLKDDDYIEALEHGLPPTAGLGIGIDRLTALLTDSNNLKEVILFPTLKHDKLKDGSIDLSQLP